MIELAGNSESLKAQDRETTSSDAPLAAGDLLQCPKEAQSISHDIQHLKGTTPSASMKLKPLNQDPLLQPHFTTVVSQRPKHHSWIKFLPSA